MRPKRLLSGNELWEYGLKLLGGRALSSGELRDKLRTRAEKKTDVDPLISRYRELGLVNDAKFAENYATRRVENERFGQARVLRDLRTRRVSAAVATRAVEQVFEGTDEVTLIEQFLEKKYRKVPLGQVLAEPKGTASAYRKLRMAGFSSGNSLRVLRKHAKDTELLESLEDGQDETPETTE